MITIFVKEFTEFPGPRYKELGDFSGEEFRNEHLIPALKQDEVICVNLDGVFGYGSSFLEEAFGGLVRASISLDQVKTIADNLIANDDPTLKKEVQQYIKEAIEAK